MATSPADEGAKVTSAALRSFLDVSSRLPQFRGNPRFETAKADLDLIRPLIRKSLIGEWQTNLAVRFLEMCAFAARSLVDQQFETPSGEAAATIGRSLSDLATLNRNMAEVAAPPTSHCDLAASAYSLVPDHLTSGPEELANAVALAVGADLKDQENLGRACEVEFVRFVAKHAKRLAGGDAFAQARVLAEPLLLDIEYSAEISECAQALGLNNNVGARDHDISDGVGPVTIRPDIWPSPTVTDADSSASSQDEILFELTDPQLTEQLTSRTKTQLERLAEGRGEGATAFFFAGNNLWSHYTRTGDPEALRVSGVLAEYVLQRAYADGASSKREFGQWLRTRLPSILLTCDISSAMESAKEKFCKNDLTAHDLGLEVSIIEAFAGIGHAHEISGQEVEWKATLATYADELRGLHRAIRPRRRGAVEEQRDVDVAWEYLFPPVAAVTPAVQLSVSTGFSVRIVDDPAFRDVIKRGFNEETREFVRDRLEEIQDVLGQRLNAKIGQDHLTLPTGKITTSRGAQRQQLDDRYVAARQELMAGELASAIRGFLFLFESRDGIARDIAADYLAYAYAKQGELRKARSTLWGIQQNYTFWSASWNLACCTPSDQRSQQIEALEIGLRRSPNPRLLHALIFLALLHGDRERLKQWLPALPYTEGLLLLYNLDYDNLDDRDREQHVIRLGQNADSEVDFIDPFGLSSPDFSSRVDEMFGQLLEREQRGVIEFWLSCRALIGRNRFDYWQLYSDYLERTGQLVDGLKAFKEEVRCRLYDLDGALLNKKNYNPTGAARYLRTRLEKWLDQAAVGSEARNLGSSIYGLVVDFDRRRGDLLRSRNIEVIPRNRKYQKQFGLGEEGSVGRDDGGVRESNSSGSLSEVLPPILVECQNRLHDVNQLSLVRVPLARLSSALRSSGYQRVADSIDGVVKEWDAYLAALDTGPKEEAFRSAGLAYAALSNFAQKDLPEQTFVIFSPLIGVFGRVNGRLLRDANLIPKLEIRPIEGATVTFNGAATVKAFAVRVRNASPRDEIRIVRATARLTSTGLEISARDRFEEIPVNIPAGGTAILTFPGFGLQELGEADGPRTLIVAAQFSYLGHVYEPPPEELSLAASDELTLPAPIASPYIHARPIDVSEIAGHFFGREEEQKEIFAAIQDGQQRFRYIEGIRRTGKSSLLSSIVYEIDHRKLDIIPVINLVNN